MRVDKSGSPSAVSTPLKEIWLAARCFRQYILVEKKNLFIIINETSSVLQDHFFYLSGKRAARFAA
jgi:hypothetical protein